jgi:hypothetical protein
LVVLVEIASIVKTNVAAESHPALLVKCAVCVPAELKVKPFQVYGNDAGQRLRFVVLVETAFTVNTNVAAESQPTLLVK